MPTYDSGETPLAYFITFSCYGARARGDERGSVERHHNQYGSPFLSPNRKRENLNREMMKGIPYRLDNARCLVVLEAIIDACQFRGWELLAAHVRTQHVHVVVSADQLPEKIMGILKARASRCLDQSGLDPARPTRWSRHGSTKYLWTPGALADVVDYVINEQGAPMAVFVGSINGRKIVGRA